MSTAPVVLVTGGAGYIGSHTLIALHEAGYAPVVVDNLDNASLRAIERVRALTQAQIPFHQVDLRDGPALSQVVAQHQPQACIHFAGLKAVGESVAQPLRYYHNNLLGTMELLRVLEEAECFHMVFSSSATVYGDAQEMPLTEDVPLSATNPYGRTKLFIEHMLFDVAAAQKRWRCMNLRYFNPVGAHPSGQIGEDPSGIPNNLMPFITQVAVGRRPHLQIFGDDYSTPDGTGVRDYIHVVDLAKAHVAALAALPKITGCEAVNVGTGRGSSVLEVLRAMEAASGRAIPYQVAPRRAGDVAVSYADPSKAQRLLGWQAEHDLTAMCQDAWRWQEQNPQGYAG
ncbi:MAG: UDP-glucose 4-epimerase GalE [Planctomycetota bacterium]|nr:MAG: UDP-glucose 4-epimerase GalE [Planctomycetota bacterium]